MIGPNESGRDSAKIRLLVLGGLIFLLFFVYIIHLFNLQIIENLIWEGRARAVSLRSDVIPPQRGKIWDRNRVEPMAQNIDSFAVSVIPAETGPDGLVDVISRLAPILDMTEEDILQTLPDSTEGLYRSIEIRDGVGFEKIVTLAERAEDFPGVVWSSKPYRWYNNTGAVSHVMGYVGTITTEELQLLYNRGYGSTSRLGKSGIEKQLDVFLRGEEGRRYRTVDVKGRRLAGSTGGIVPPTNGYDVVLTIDRHIQSLAENALGPRKGSVVVLKPSTGEILALVSYPSFDPNRFQVDGPSDFESLSLNTDFPFLNRALQSTYAPASTFKVLMTAAILGSGKLDPDKPIECRGVMTLGNREFWCHKKSGHGSLTLRQALAESCNIYFGTAGVEYLGIDTISEYARAMGLGSLTGIDLGGETPGIVPSPAWKERTYNTPWTGGDTLNVSVGQGFLSVTPLQMANVIAAVINDGKVYRPHLLKELRHPVNGALIEETEPELLREVDLLTAEDYRFIRNAMRGVITDGTAQWALYNLSVEVAGKTGTGEVGSEENWHSWFVSFGPYETDNPDERVVVVTMVEASNEWDWWAPKAADLIYEGIFSNRSYSEVKEEWERRRVWWITDAHPLPSPGEPPEPPEIIRDPEEENAVATGEDTAAGEGAG